MFWSFFLLKKKIPPTGTNSKPSKIPLIPGKLNCLSIISPVQSSVSEMQQRATEVHKIQKKKEQDICWRLQFLEEWKGDEYWGEQKR